jgi:hypothetical protein
MPAYESLPVAGEQDFPSLLLVVVAKNLGDSVVRPHALEVIAR